MIKVLIAVDDSETSVLAARTAHRLPSDSGEHGKIDL
jgi:hypothetical protein